MNHGIADAVQIVKQLVTASKGERTQKEAVDAYNEEMIPRSGEEVQICIGNTEMLHDWARAQQSPLLTRGGYPNPPKK